MAAVATAGVTGGCLVFSEPINTPPRVAMSEPGIVHRGKAVDLVATASDDEQASDTLKYRWFRSNGACSAGVDETGAPVSVTTQFRLLVDTLSPLCVVVEVTDDHGASGRFARDINVANQLPMPVIALALQPALQPNTKPLGPSEFPLYSELRLTARQSSDPDGDAVTFTWTVTGPAGALTPVPCADTPDGRDICLPLLVPGAYVATLDVNDGQSNAEKPATFAFEVLPDHAPCFVAGNPAITRVLRDPVKTTRLSVDEVWDDGDPYPPVRPDQKHNFRWSWRKNAGPTWERPPMYTLPFFELPAGAFDIGDVVEVRVQIEDRIDRKLHERCGEDEGECTVDTPPRHWSQELPKCLQRFTWTVEYRL